MNKKTLKIFQTFGVNTGEELRKKIHQEIRESKFDYSNIIVDSIVAAACDIRFQEESFGLISSYRVLYLGFLQEGLGINISKYEDISAMGIVSLLKGALHESFPYEIKVFEEMFDISLKTTSELGNYIKQSLSKGVELLDKIDVDELLKAIPGDVVAKFTDLIPKEGENKN